MKRIFAIAFVLSLALGAVSAQDKAPTLTTEQKQAIQIKAQEMTIAQLQFDKARGELAALVQSLQKDGYDLDLQTMTYVKKAPAK